MTLARRSVIAGLGASMMRCSPQEEIAVTKAPLIIAHRGASGALPEHTLAAYRRAAEQGADVIEPDLVFTKDGHLICRHDRYLSGSTNVADKPEFAQRRRADPVTGAADWFAEDFTLKEIKTLRARQPFNGRDTRYDDLYDVPTFEDVLAEAARHGWRLYPEAKQPGVAAKNGHDFKAALGPFYAAAHAGTIGASFVQCFDPAWLKTMPKHPQVARIQLLYLPPGAAAPALDDIAAYAEGIGPNKDALVTSEGQPSALLKDAKARGLMVHPWTFRSDQLPDRFGLPSDEYAAFFSLGVDGVFSDFTADAVAARESWLRQL